MATDNPVFSYAILNFIEIPVGDNPTSLNALTLSSNSVAENSTAGTIIGSLNGTSVGSVLTLTNNASGRFALSGSNIVTGSTITDFEVNQIHNIEVTESLAGASNSPRVTPLSITVTNVFEAGSLSVLTLSANNVTSAAPAGTVIGTVQNTTVGSTLSLSDDAGGRVALSGTSLIAGATPTNFGSATTHNFVIVETLADSPNSPRSTNLSISVSEAPSGNVTLSNPRTNVYGSMLMFDVTGGTWGDVSIDPSGIILEGDVASVNASGVTNTLRTRIPVGLKAELITGVLNVWIEGAVFSDYSNLTVSVAAASVVSGSDICNSLSSTAVTNNNTVFTSPMPAGHIVGVVTGRTGLLVEHSVVRGAWRAEAAGIHFSGLAGVEWTITKNGQAAVVTWQSEERRSWYQDTNVIDNTQWTANVSSGEGGLGVWPSPSGDGATDPTGPVTITALFVPKIGGRARARTMTWTIYSAQAGAYPERQVWLDTVSGSDGNDGLTSGTAKATLAAACNTAGSVTGGATQTTVPIVNIVGGTSGSPRDIDVNTLPVTGSGSAIPSSTDTWLTLRPAPGFAKDTIRIVNHAGLVTGVGQRIRRLCLENLIVDISDGPSGSSSKTLLSGNTTVYPPASNPQMFWMNGVTHTHRQGKIGHTTEGNSGNFFGTTFTKLNKAYWTNWEHTDTGQRGIQSNPYNMIRNARIVKIQKDVLKAPDCVFGLYSEDNAVDPVLLPVGSVTGTPTAGDTVTGVYSWPASETVETYTTGMVKLTPGGNSYSFKPDDSKTHVAITISSETGTIAVGETIRNAADNIRFLVYRRDGNILRGAYTVGAGFSNGSTITGLTSGATFIVSSIATGQVSLFFTPSGARAAAAPPHPDGLQIQNFYPTRLVLTNIVGTFQIGEEVTCPGIAATADPVITAINGSTFDFSGNPLWEIRTADTITGNVSGATATIQTAYAINNDANILLANLLFRRTDGQILFGENGAGNVGIYNVIGAKIDHTSALVSQFGNVPGLIIAHCTLPNQQLRSPIITNHTKINGTPPGGQVIIHCIFRAFSADYVPILLSASSPDKGRPGLRFSNHLAQPVGMESTGERGVDVYVSKGDPSFVNGIAWNESDFTTPITKTNFKPQAAVPTATAVTTANRLSRYDILGIERLATDWPGAVSSR